MFKNRKLCSHISRPRRVTEKVLKPYVVDGVTRFQLVSVPVDGSKIPDPSKYRLHDLLDAGIPLNVVSPIIVASVPSDIQLSHMVDSITNSKLE